MKLPAIKLKFRIRPGLILLAAFLILVIFEAYLLYYRVYINLYTTVDEISVEDVVRLNLKDYNAALEAIDKRQNFTAPTLNINNPF